MRRFWTCAVALFVCWVVSGCGPAPATSQPPTAGPTTDPVGEAFSKPTKRVDATKP
jgi:hypothetical protein